MRWSLFIVEHDNHIQVQQFQVLSFRVHHRSSLDSTCDLRRRATSCHHRTLRALRPSRHVRRRALGHIFANSRGNNHAACQVPTGTPNRKVQDGDLSMLCCEEHGAVLLPNLARCSFLGSNQSNVQTTTFVRHTQVAAMLYDAQVRSHVFRTLRVVSYISPIQHVDSADDHVSKDLRRFPRTKWSSWKTQDVHASVEAGDTCDRRHVFWSRSRPKGRDGLDRPFGRWAGFDAAEQIETCPPVSPARHHPWIVGDELVRVFQESLDDE